MPVCVCVAIRSKGVGATETAAATVTLLFNWIDLYDMRWLISCIAVVLYSFVYSLARVNKCRAHSVLFTVADVQMRFALSASLLSSKVLIGI